MVKLKLGKNKNSKSFFYKIYITKKKTKYPFNYGHKIGIYNKITKSSIIKINNFLLICKLGFKISMKLNKLILNTINLNN